MCREAKFCVCKSVGIRVEVGIGVAVSIGIEVGVCPSELVERSGVGIGVAVGVTIRTGVAVAVIDKVGVGVISDGLKIFNIQLFPVRAMTA